MDGSRVGRVAHRRQSAPTSPANLEPSAGLCDGRGMTDPTSSVPVVETGFVGLGGLRMYYEVHGDAADTAPLVLLHGGLFDIDQQFGALIPALASGRRVVAVDFQGHG